MFTLIASAVFGGFMLPKPVDVFDRDAEWPDLAEFAGSALPGMRSSVVVGDEALGKLVQFANAQRVGLEEGGRAARMIE
jgi:hypothetical protein